MPNAHRFSLLINHLIYSRQRYKGKSNGMQIAKEEVATKLCWWGHFYSWTEADREDLLALNIYRSKSTTCRMRSNRISFLICNGPSASSSLFRPFNSHSSECDGNRNLFNIDKGAFARTNSTTGHTAISGSNPSIKDDGRYLQDTLTQFTVGRLQSQVYSFLHWFLFLLHEPRGVFLHIMFEIQKAAKWK